MRICLCNAEFHTCFTDEHTGESHYLSREIIQHLKQQEGEIHMNPVQENLVYPLQEGFMRDFNAIAEDPMSSLPTLMLSLPGSLRSEPVETTDNYSR